MDRDPAEAAAGEARAEAARNRLRKLDEVVQLFGAVFKVDPARLVRLEPEAAEPGHVVRFEQPDRLHDPGALADHMQRAAVLAFGQDRPGDFELFKRHVAQGSDVRIHPGQLMRGRFAILAADIVLRVDEVVLRHRIDHHDRISGRQRHRAEHFDRTEVRQNHRIFLAENRAELVEKPALEPHIVVFDSLPDPRPVGLRQFDAERFGERETGRGFERRRARHAGRQRNRALHPGIEGADPDAALFKFDDHALDVVAPVPRNRGRDVAEIELAHAVVPEILDPAVFAVHGGQRELRVLLDRARKHETLVVVGVVAEDFEPPRRLRRYRRFLPVELFELLNQLLHVSTPLCYKKQILEIHWSKLSRPLRMSISIRR